LKYLKLYEMNRQSSKGSNKGDSLIQ
jgi:hypothetical protein